MKCQGLYLGSPCKDSWFEVDWWVIKRMNALGVAVRLALGENQWRCTDKLSKNTSFAYSSTPAMRIPEHLAKPGVCNWALAGESMLSLQRVALKVGREFFTGAH
jgi:hypothetical protein